MRKKKMTDADAEKVAFYRSEIERITGKMVSLRDREAYKIAMREVQKNRRARLKERMEVLLRKEKKLKVKENA